jgi:hypothetical protein
VNPLASIGWATVGRSVSLPGPPAPLWAVALLLWAAAAVVLGEFLRASVARWVRIWRSPEIIERVLVDFYLGGAVVYLVAAVPVGAFIEPVVLGLPLAAGAGILVRVGRARRAGVPPMIDRAVEQLLRPPALLAVASALGLYLVELAVALPTGTGNTYDSSLLTTYTALLVSHHSIPLSFQPFATSMILYPQGTTVWLGWAETVFQLPAARTSLFVTPLFLALPPLSGFVFGRRWFGSDRGGAAVALVLAWLGPGTRALVGGSNDFAFAFPLVLLLAGQSVVWFDEAGLSWSDAVGFGLLLGYSAALNPIGAEWLFPALVVTRLASSRVVAGGYRRWLGRWGLSGAAMLIPMTPSLYVLGLGLGSPGFVPGASGPPSSVPVGISWAGFLGSIDPFLFRAGDVELSPVPFLRLELAVLLVLGLIALVSLGRSPELRQRFGRFRTWALAAGLVIGGELALLAGADAGASALRDVAAVSNGAELSLWIFSLFALIVSVPLGLALERIEWVRVPPADVGSPSHPRPQRRWGQFRHLEMIRTVAPVALAAAIVVPGLLLTPTALAGVLTTLYSDFGNVSSADFALLENASNYLPPGSRVLVAPGSAAEFLPGYVSDIVLLYPLVPGWPWINASYTLVVSELTNGTLDARGNASLAALGVGFIAVTMNNTVLWPAFSPAPFLADPSTFPLLFHVGDAYLFARR